MLHTANSNGVQEAVILETEAQTLTNKEVIQPVATHDYGTGHVDWTLSATEQKATVLSLAGKTDLTGAGIIATPTNGKVFVVINATAQTITIKAKGKTGVAVATTKTAIVMGNGTDFIRLTADA